jgi:trk system potassium uptake protein TrkA
MGCGRVGSTLAQSLEHRGHTVAVIDVNADAFRRLGADFQGLTITGIGFDREILITAGIERADAFAAVSNGDNSNITRTRGSPRSWPRPRRWPASAAGRRWPRS